MYEKVFQLYDEKLKGNLQSDSITFTCRFYATAKIGQLDRCEKILILVQFN